MVKKRSAATVILLNFVTFGIYSLVVFYQMGKEINNICEGDGKHQINYLVAYLLLGPVTLFIFPLVWIYTAMNRLQDNAYRYGKNVYVPNSGASYILWGILGSFIIVGPFIAMIKFIDDVNAFADCYGKVQPLPYTIDPNQRNTQNFGRKEPIAAPQPVAGYNGSNNAQFASRPTDGFENHGYSGAPVQQPKENVINAVPPTIAKSYSPVGKITGVSGMYTGYEIPIENGSGITIGTDPERSIVVISEGGMYVSGKHCTITYNSAKGNYAVEDCSSNGTFLQEGDMLPQNTRVVLDEKTVIYLGDASNGFRLG